MRVVPIAEFKDRVSEYVNAAGAGDEIMITRHGKPMAKLVTANEDPMKVQREAITRLHELGQKIRRDRGPTPIDDIVGWIREDRR
jgi:prevent-host-death family protein